MKYLFSLIFALFISFSIDAQWTQTNGPYGGNVNCFAKFDSVLYSGLSGAGVFKSINNGDSWININNNLSDLNVNAIIISGSNIFIGCQGIYLSSNSGNSWIFSGLGECGITSFASIGSYIFAGSGCGVYLTTNNGVNWVSKNNGLINTYVRCITVSEGKIYAGTDNGLYVSSNYGDNWQSLYSSSTFISSVAVSNQNIYLGVYKFVIHSSDGGLNWNLRWGLPDYDVNSIVISDSIIYAGTGGAGIYYSTNSGYSWYPSNFIGYDVNCLYKNSNQIYLGTNINGAFISNDGLIWNQINEGLNGLEINCFGSSGPNLIINAYLLDGVFSSSNSGQNFQFLNNGIVSVKSFENVNNYLFAAVGGGYFGSKVSRSSDNGLSWERQDYGLPVPGWVYILKFYNNRLYAGTNQGVYYTTNYGQNWVACNSGMSNKTVYSFVKHNSNLFAGTRDNGIYRSSDFGNNWLSVNNGLNGLGIVNLGVIGDNIFAVADKLCVSTNDGDNWSILYNYELYSLLTYNNYLFVTRGFSGVYMSTNLGITFYPINDGFPIGNQRIREIFICNNYIYVSSEFQSVWHRPLSEIVNVDSSITKIADYFLLNQNYPNPFNPTTNIKYKIANNKFVSLKVFDILGKEIETLVNEKQSPGTYEVNWKASTYPSGVYFYRLVTDGFTDTKKMILLK
jgi:photosystem II stability/assembly factor-like uncharacterized protein